MTTPTPMLTEQVIMQLQRDLAAAQANRQYTCEAHLDEVKKGGRCVWCDLNAAHEELNTQAHELERLLNELSAAQERIRELETALLGVKEYREKNPLGGPAKVFDAMADAIRAGDDFNAVCADYGWCPLDRAIAAEARAEAAEKDAGRYQWLRDKSLSAGWGVPVVVTMHAIGTITQAMCFQNLDDAVDAAIAEGE